MWNSGNQERKWENPGSHEQPNLATRITTIPLDEITENSVDSVPDFLSSTFIPAVFRDYA
jgi:hypothetical protein